jgi:WD40 repeat protein
MLLPNEGVELLFKHSSSVLKIFHFDFNDPNHFISLSDDGEIIEWFFNIETLHATEIVKFHLKRPDDDLLAQNKHKVRELKRDEYYKITQVLQFEDFLSIGYSDGVILVYQITKKAKSKNAKQEKKKKNDNQIKEQNENKSKSDAERGEGKEGVAVEYVDSEEEQKESNSMSGEDKNESESHLNLNNDIEKEKEEEVNEKENVEDNDNENISVDLDYYNFFSLYYVLLGHVQDILSLCYIPQTKMIVSSSDDFTVKIYDFNTGHLIYFFKLDFIINRILYQNIGRNKNENKIVLTLLSNDPVKLIINLSTNPITFNNYFFKHNEIIQLEKMNDKYYLLNERNVLILDKNFEQENAFISLDNISFKYFNTFKNDNLIVDNENYIRKVNFIQKKDDKDKNAKDKKNDKNKKQKNAKNNNEPQEEESKINETIIITECKFRVGEDSINGFYFLDKYIFAYCQDGRLYLINYDKIKENYERMQMAIEDLASLRMMSSLVIVKKPKKKAKGKKGKDKKK